MERRRKRQSIDYAREVSQPKAEAVYRARKSKCKRNLLGCMTTTASTNTDGYSQVWFKPKSLEKDSGRSSQKAFLLHIIAFIAFNEVYDPGMHVSHLCDNRRCFNPKHLVQESPQVNNSRKNCLGEIHCARGHVHPVCRHQPRCIRPVATQPCRNEQPRLCSTQ